MWYFAWALGVGFALLLAILNVLWYEYSEEREAALRKNISGKKHDQSPP